MFWQAIHAVGDLKRLYDIATVLIRHGFGDLVQRTGMARALKKAGKVLHWSSESSASAVLGTPARLRRVLEDLGPTFVKLGQVLATRVDLFPGEVIDELSKLQDSAPALDFEKIRLELAAALSEGNIESVFARIDINPLAAASLAQVHRACLTDGQEVVLKIRRPGIKTVVEADLRLLQRLADILETQLPDLRCYRPREVVRQFMISLRRELDFSVEGRNSERIAANFSEDSDIVIPKVYWDYSSERLSVQQFIAGIPARRLDQLEQAGYDRQLLARRGARAVLKMILEDGFFHADPHPGNIYFLPNDRIALVDFGMVGRITDEGRYQLASMLHGLVTHDSSLVAEVLVDWSLGIEVDSDSLKRDIDSFVDLYHSVPLKHLDIGEMLSDLFGVLRDHGLALPPDLALLVKAFITLEGFGRQLDPDFDMASEAAPFLKHILLTNTLPGILIKRGWRTLTGTLGLITGLPQDLRQLLRSARRGRLGFQVEIPASRQIIERLDRSISRLALSIVTSALIVASAILLTIENTLDFSQLSLLGQGILAFSGGALLWVILSIWRSGHD